MIDTFLLNCLWQGLLVVAIAALVTAAVPQRHAATRYAVWFVALLALLFVPLATLWHPEQPLPALSSPIVVRTTAIATRATNHSGLWPIVVWVAGIAFFLMRLVRSHVRIRRIVRAALPAPTFGPDVMTSDDVDYPIAAGFFAPMVILPSKIAAALERSDIEAIVRHERAHIARRDILTNLAQRLIEACLFFNPWVYVIGRQLLTEREAACDDWVVNATGEADRYATCLAQLASGTHATHTPLLTPSALGSRRMLVGRIARLLNGKAMQLKTNYLVLCASTLAFGALAIVLQTTTGQAAPTTIAATNTSNCNREATVLKPAPPDYPASASPASGAATAVVVVSPSGEVASVKIVKSSGVPALDAATVKAAWASTYSPAMSNCKAVQGSYAFHAEFKPS